MCLQISDLETELEGEQKRHHESVKELRKSERQCKEMAWQAGEDKKKRDSLQEQLERLQAKMKNYRLQIEETENLAAYNLNKFRRIQHRMEENAKEVERTVHVQPRGKSEQVTFSRPYCCFLLFSNKLVSFTLNREATVSTSRRACSLSEFESPGEAACRFHHFPSHSAPPYF